MNAKQRADLKAKMQAEIATLRETIASLEATTAPVEPDVAIGRLSRLDTMQNQAITSASLTNTKRRLLKLEAALKRIDEEDFGLCEECGKPIPVARLLAMPESSLCVECAE